MAEGSSGLRNTGRSFGGSIIHGVSEHYGDESAGTMTLRGYCVAPWRYIGCNDQEILRTAAGRPASSDHSVPRDCSSSLLAFSYLPHVFQQSNLCATPF
jgi:hypothetical protein